jgi:cytosine deaminase
MNPFKTLRIPEPRRYCITQARVPTCFLPDGPRTALDRDGATLVDLVVNNDKIAAIEPAGGAASADLPAIDLGSRHVWPTLIDMHAHLDKGHIVTRTENPDGSFAGALQSTIEDRTQRWTAGDVKQRMEFGLRCAYVHGVAAIRTHLDSLEPDQAQRSWAVFREVQAEWADRVLLQAVALVPIDAFRTPYGRELADLVAASGGILGGVTRAVGGVHGQLLDDIDPLLDTILRLASERGLESICMSTRAAIRRRPRLRMSRRQFCATASRVAWFVAIVAALRSSPRSKFAERSISAPRRVSRWSRCRP